MRKEGGVEKEDKGGRFGGGEFWGGFCSWEYRYSICMVWMLSCRSS